LRRRGNPVIVLNFTSNLKYVFTLQSVEVSESSVFLEVGNFFVKSFYADSGEINGKSCPFTNAMT